MAAIAPDLRFVHWPESRWAAACEERRRSRRRVSWIKRGLAALGLVVITASMAVVAAPRLTGGAAVRVHGSSMGSAYPVGSLVVTAAVERSAVRVGDVVLMRNGAGTAPLLHRVVKLERIGGNLVATTKGDANPKPDPKGFVLPQEVQVGRHVAPYVGHLLAAVRTPLGWALLLMLPATALTAAWLVEIWSPTESTPRIRWRNRDHASWS